jgi:hypothetical protein
MKHRTGGHRMYAAWSESPDASRRPAQTWRPCAFRFPAQPTARAKRCTASSSGWTPSPYLGRVRGRASCTGRAVPGRSRCRMAYWPVLEACCGRALRRPLRHQADTPRGQRHLLRSAVGVANQARTQPVAPRTGEEKPDPAPRAVYGNGLASGLDAVSGEPAATSGQWNVAHTPTNWPSAPNPSRQVTTRCGRGPPTLSPALACC